MRVTTAGQGQVTRILATVSDGDPVVARQLLPLVYDELRRLAGDRMRHEPAGLTLQPTALVHEAYLRLVGNDATGPVWNNRGHFFAAAAEAMRRILVERARRKGRHKHGGGRQREDLDDDQVAWSDAPRADLLDLDAALQKLEVRDPLRAKIVTLRYFAGLTVEQTADALQIAPATVKRHWNYARAWLCREMLAADTSAPES